MFIFREILEAMEADSRLGLTSLLVDGGMSQSGLLMQIQSDLIGIPVLRPAMAETTALGAAIAGASNIIFLPAAPICRFTDILPQVHHEVLPPCLKSKLSLQPTK